jgi:protein tyrosine/serine phosphatase
LFFLAGLPKAQSQTKSSQKVRPSNWATSIQQSGLPNFFKVSEDLYRGAQPTKEGFKKLKEMGVKTVVNLRSFHSDRSELKGLGMNYEHIYMKAWHPERHEVIRFFKIVTDKNKIPVFVHCQHGADRTGTMVALYRIVIQGWTKEAAIREMTQGGFGYHSVWKDLIKFIQGFDVDALKKELSIRKK